jgi:hypothetical protein
MGPGSNNTLLVLLAGLFAVWCSYIIEGVISRLKPNVELYNTRMPKGKPIVVAVLNSGVTVLPWKVTQGMIKLR